MRARSVLILPALFLALSSAADPIRVLCDEPRDRTWILGTDAVYLHERGISTPPRRFALPGWIYLKPPYAREPDLLVEPGGTVIVSSNIMSRLWRIDADAASTEELDIALQPGSDRDFGFSALEMMGHGALRATSSTDRSRWQIDLAARSASRVGGDD